MKSKSIYIIIAVVLTASVVTIAALNITSKHNSSTGEENSNPRESTSKIQISDITTDNESKVVIGDITTGSNDNENTDSLADEQNNVLSPVELDADNVAEIQPTVVEIDVIEENKPITESKPGKDVIEIGQKEDDTEKGIDADGDVINDKILEAKEKSVKEQESKDDEEHPTIVLEEKVVIDDTTKAEVVVVEEKPDDGFTEDTKTSGSGYVPQSGDHPFVDPVDKGDGQTVDVEDIIDEGEDKPGEGIHF